MKTIINKEEVLFDAFFKVKKANLKHELYGGEWSANVDRYSYEKGDAVAALLFDSQLRQLIMIEQYRYPARRWIQELVAGGLESNENPKKGIEREILEETGHIAKKSEYLGLYYVAPGVFSERVHLFISEVRPAVQSELDSVEIDEGEDICVIRIAYEDVEDYLKYPVDDLKTRLTMQHWILNYRL